MPKNCRLWLTTQCLTPTLPHEFLEGLEISILSGMSAYYCLQNSKSPSLSIIMICWPWQFSHLFYAVFCCSDIVEESKTSKTTKVGNLSINHPIWISFSSLHLVPSETVVLWRNILHHIISFVTKLSIWQDEKKLLQPFEKPVSCFASSTNPLLQLLSFLLLPFGQHLDQMW